MESDSNVAQSERGSVWFGLMSCGTVWHSDVCGAVQRGAAQHSAVQCSAVQRSAAQCNAVQRSAAKCSEVQRSAAKCRPGQGRAGQCSAIVHGSRFMIHGSCFAMAVQRSAAKCSEVQRSAAKCSEVQGGAGQGSAVQSFMVHGSWFTVHYSWLVLCDVEVPLTTFASVRAGGCAATRKWGMRGLLPHTA